MPYRVTRTVRYAAGMAAAMLGACSGESGPSFEVVVNDARINGAAPVVLGATADTLMWSASPGSGTTLVSGSSLTALPATGLQLATASGPVAHAGDAVLFAADRTISRVGLDATVQRLTTAEPEALAGSTDAIPVMAWTSGAVVSWGVDDAQQTATLNRIDRCDHARVSARHIFVAADGASGRRLLRIEQSTGVITPVTASSTWAPMFPGTAADGSTYRGRIVHADDDGALWLVEEVPSGRGILVSEPVQGDAAVLLQHVTSASAFFATPEALYWQEDDALLSAPRAGGPAEIVATLPGAAGAVADGYVYFVDGNAIKRLALE